MAVGVASTGIHQTTNIKFSQLRREFKTISPRTTFDGSDDHSGDTGSVSASELLRNTSLSVADPVVPDVDENANITTTESNWNISGFKNAIKYYYLNQTDIDDNDGEERVGFSVTDPSVNSAYSTIDFLSWKESIGKNILKKAFIDGVVGSVVSDKEALSVGNNIIDINNLLVSIGGSVYGSAGYGDATRRATLTLNNNYSFPIGAAVTQYTGFGTYVAVGIVSSTTSNSNTVDIIQSTDLEFLSTYSGVNQVDSTYFTYKKFRVINDSDNQLYVNDTATGLTVSSKTESTSTSASNGGNAISFNITGSSNNVKISVGSAATIYGGGGGGGKGGNGGRGGDSATQGNACGTSLPGEPFGNASGSPGNSGGMGGMGRGYVNKNRQGTENPILGEPGNGKNVKYTYTSAMGQTNTGGAGGEGGEGGDGGQYGGSGGAGGTGATGGTGGNAAVWCSPGTAIPGSPGSPGTDGTNGASGGSSINGSGWDWAPEVNTDNVDASRQIRGSYTYGIPSP